MKSGSTRKDSGSAHIIIMAALAIALIAALGFIFWQNILNKPTVHDSTTIVKKLASPSPSVTTLKTYCTSVEKLCFDYPSGWTVAQEVVTDDDTNGQAQRYIISDQTRRPWLTLQTGLDGIGGTCGNDDGSSTDILESHTTAISGQYLINEAAKDYLTGTMYAVGWASYSGTDKSWTIGMNLNNQKAAITPGKVDPCDLGLGVFNGKNTVLPNSEGAGAIKFGYYDSASVDNTTTYPTETAAAAALATSDAKSAFAILQSAHYQ